MAALIPVFALTAVCFSDHHTGMDTAEITSLIWAQTSRYPFLVSRICQLIDEQVI